MKTCDDCKYAEWQRTAAGRLHPSKRGRCTYPWKMPPLPAAMYWVGGDKAPSGGFIRRREEHDNHCPYWARAEGKR